MMHSTRGFALVISIVLTSVVLALGSALLDIAYKQILLSSTAKNSQYAFYNADSAMECALYWDQKFNTFGYSNNPVASNILCNNIAVTAVPTFTQIIGVNRETQFTVPCTTGGVSGYVKIYKNSNGSTIIYANGYSSCDAALATRVERGLKISY